MILNKISLLSTQALLKNNLVILNKHNKLVANT